MQFIKRPLPDYYCRRLDSCWIPRHSAFSVSANGAQVNKSVARRASTSTVSLRSRGLFRSTRGSAPRHPALSSREVRCGVVIDHHDDDDPHDHYHDDSDVHLNDDTGIDDDRARLPRRPSRYHDDQTPTQAEAKENQPTSLQKGSFEWRFPKIVGPLRSCGPWVPTTSFFKGP